MEIILIKLLLSTLILVVSFITFSAYVNNTAFSEYSLNTLPDESVMKEKEFPEEQN
jgi:hypothetical protein